MNKMWIKYALQSCSTLLAVCLLCQSSQAQYYYKDIVITNQISASYRLLKVNKVTLVKISPFESNGPAKEGVILEQTVQPAQNLVLTYTKVPDNGESWLKSYYSVNGFLTRTVDSTVDLVTRTDYEYDGSERLVSISSNSITKDLSSETEIHQWTYNSNGRPEKMLKIKNGNDSTEVSFLPDDQGNVGEEKAIRKKGNLGTTYFYYDDQHRLTDIARYNKKADRILPEYMFEFNATGQLSQMIIVPEGSSDYQIWKYSYNQQGLKSQEVCYNKRKQLLGKIEYSYSFNW